MAVSKILNDKGFLFKNGFTTKKFTSAMLEKGYFEDVLIGTGDDSTITFIFPEDGIYVLPIRNFGSQFGYNKIYSAGIYIGNSGSIAKVWQENQYVTGSYEYDHRVFLPLAKDTRVVITDNFSSANWVAMHLNQPYYIPI